MNFQEIILSHSETRLLKSSIRHTIPADKCKRLLRLGLVCETTLQTERGGIPRKTGLCIISDLGVDYLSFRKDLNRTRFVIPIIVSVITTAIINAGIYWLPKLLSLIQELI